MAPERPIGSAYDAVTDYDRTRRADDGLVDFLAMHLMLQTDAAYLDIGAGTGNYTTALAERAGHWTASDPAPHMLSQARAKHDGLNLAVAAAEALPFAACAFDGLLCQLALHHMSDVPRAIAEMARVLQPGGRAVLFTVLPTQARANWLAHYFPQMIAADAKTLPDLSALTAAAQAAGLGCSPPYGFHVTPDTTERFFYGGTYCPEIYLDAQMRANMSPFRLFANATELRQGLAALQADIASGAVHDRVAQSDRRAGDYCALVLTKPQ